MLPAENQNTEWKESWNDDYLRWVCGFANAYGGCICIGKNDRGETVGLSAKECRKLCEDIPNKVRDTMGVMVDVNLREEGGKQFVEIQVPPVSYPVNYRGEYHYRSGSTKQRLIGAALTHFLLRKTGLRWDAVPVDGVTPAELDEESFELFREKALSTHRMSPEDLALSRTELLDKLNLLDNGQLKRAALLLFHRRPERWFTGAWVKIGFFENHAEIVYQDELHGSLMMLAERVIDLLYTKYMRAPITYEGVTRVEKYPFPKDAVREALYNALIHADYSAGVPIQISVYKDKLYTPHTLNSSSDTYPGDQWVTVEAEVRDGHVVFRAGGRDVLAFDDPQLDDGTPVRSGTISIQSESAPTDFRRIAVKPLPCEKNPRVTAH